MDRHLHDRVLGILPDKMTIHMEIPVIGCIVGMIDLRLLFYLALLIDNIKSQPFHLHRLTVYRKCRFFQTIPIVQLLTALPGIYQTADDSHYNDRNDNISRHPFHLMRLSPHILPLYYNTRRTVMILWQ